MNKSAWYKLQLYIVAIISFQFCCERITAQDTLSLTIQDAEKSFLQNNLSLLASKYNINASRALVRQAKLWDNPVISADQNIYDAQGKFFRHDNNFGQVYIQVMQLIKTAGKRNKLAQLAEDNTTISEEQFDDLIRTLRYTLISDLTEISHQLEVKNVYVSEIEELQKLVAAMDIQLKSGNISVKDNMRIKALLFGLQNELIGVQTQIIPLQSEVKLLLKNTDNTFIKPLLNYSAPDLTHVSLPGKEVILDSVLQNRPDARIARSLLDYQKHNLIYQKALVKPDISIGTEYDQRSSYAPNYIGLTISFPLNILNKNQGSIAAAKYNISQQQALVDVQSAKIISDISSAYDRIKFYQQVNSQQQMDFINSYNTLFRNMLNSYVHRQVSLLEFIDFSEAYRDIKLKVLDQYNGLIKSIIDLNYMAGKDVITLK